MINEYEDEYEYNTRGVFGSTTATDHVYYYGVDPAHRAERIRSSEEMKNFLNEIIEEEDDGRLLFDPSELYI